ncbi:MAG: transporter substrate-binding domain-containing protein [Oscillospiraceae bacterium]|nr:transporter substrate-binding domain-containing protein [Oscillospiraceae bacterium]
MKKLIALFLAALMALACFAGCAAGKTDTDTPETTEQKDQKIAVVGYTIYEPMNYFDGDKLVGFDTELAEAVFAKLGYKVLFQEIKWENKYTDLNSDAIDCVWNGFTANAADDDGIQRSEKVAFSYNYMENRQVIVTKKDAGIAAAADLKGKMGAAEGGSAGESYGKSFEGANIKAFDVQTKCIFEVNAGTADFAVVDEQLAKSYVGKGDYANLQIVEALSSDVEFYAIGFKKGNPLVKAVNEQLEALAADGTIAELAEKYPKVKNSVITDFSNQK